MSAGLTFGNNPAPLGRMVEAVRAVVKRGALIVKLSPNVTDITETTRAANPWSSIPGTRTRANETTPVPDAKGGHDIH